MWSKNAADLFAETDEKTLKESKLANAWLSRNVAASIFLGCYSHYPSYTADGSSASGRSFSSNKERVPDGYNRKNNLKTDAALHLGNVAEIYSSPLVTLDMDVVEAIDSSRGNSFVFACYAEDLSETFSDSICREPGDNSYC